MNSKQYQVSLIKYLQPTFQNSGVNKRNGMDCDVEPVMNSWPRVPASVPPKTRRGEGSKLVNSALNVLPFVESSRHLNARLEDSLRTRSPLEIPEGTPSTNLSLSSSWSLVQQIKIDSGNDSRETIYTPNRANPNILVFSKN
ncbi:hypothetical protein TNCV_4272901 [Trichonephila clavipes]|nr:hypothetical protein TNCV_4272901 [Trichonephila clavipes]